MRRIRALVSGNRTRFKDGSYDLDLSYITPNIISMGFPSTGVESAYVANGLWVVCDRTRIAYGGRESTSAMYSQWKSREVRNTLRRCTFDARESAKDRTRGSDRSGGVHCESES